MEGVKEIRRRAWSLSGVLASPVRENDYAEKARRVELQRYAPVRRYDDLINPLSGDSRGLSRGLNRSLTNMRSLGSYATSMMPKR